VAEYLAEGAIAPIVMIRRGRHKFVHSPPDPDQLYDLASDPGERANLAGDPASAGLAGEFRREVAARWDLATLDRDVRHSQRRRIAVSGALRTGAPDPWDFTPAYDASRRYIRNHADLADLEKMARFPPAGRRLTLSLEQAEFPGPGDGLAARGGFQLPVDGHRLRLDGVRRQEHLGADRRE
jgi:choline-sulfatase